MNKWNILITWWLWYIWSHVVVDFLANNYNVVVIDDLSNSNENVKWNIEKITWKEFQFYKVDLKDKESLREVFQKHNFDWVIHLAWYKAVWESCEKPFDYYDNNIIWSLNLFKLMEKFNVKRIIFSSSATVYDSEKQDAPFYEWHTVWNTTNPYWTTKLIIENILRDLSNHKWFKVTNLRYFNPIWAHKSWLIWEDPNWVPWNLLPYIMKVVTWELKQVNIFWNDYDTKDWTWERDYIHVLDLSKAHLDSFELQETSYEEINVWNWKWTSVLEIIEIVEEIIWRELPKQILWRRSWDIATLFCMNWKSKAVFWYEQNYSIREAIQDQYKFVMKNKKEL